MAEDKIGIHAFLGCGVRSMALNTTAFVSLLRSLIELIFGMHMSCFSLRGLRSEGSTWMTASQFRAMARTIL